MKLNSPNPQKKIAFIIAFSLMFATLLAFGDFSAFFLRRKPM